MTKADQSDQPSLPIVISCIPISMGNDYDYDYDYDYDSLQAGSLMPCPFSSFPFFWGGGGKYSEDVGCSFHPLHIATYIHYTSLVVV